MFVRGGREEGVNRPVVSDNLVGRVGVDETTVEAEGGAHCPEKARVDTTGERLREIGLGGGSKAFEVFIHGPKELGDVGSQCGAVAENGQACSK